MPIWLRKFTWFEIDKFYRDETKSRDNTTSNNQGNKTLVSPDGTVNVPDFDKASKPYKGKISYK